MPNLFLALLLSVSVAQQPGAPSAPLQISPEMLQQLMGGTMPDANAEIAYASQDAALQRWPDTPGSAAQIKKGDRLTVVLRRPDGLVRVAHGGDFGWVAGDLLSAEAVQADPAASDAPPAP